jgi:hypothetical protein
VNSHPTPAVAETAAYRDERAEDHTSQSFGHSAHGGRRRRLYQLALVALLTVLAVWICERWADAEPGPREVSREGAVPPGGPAGR